MIDLETLLFLSIAANIALSYVFFKVLNYYVKLVTKLDIRYTMLAEGKAKEEVGKAMDHFRAEMQTAFKMVGYKEDAEAKKHEIKSEEPILY